MRFQCPTPFLTLAITPLRSASIAIWQALRTAPYRHDRTVTDGLASRYDLDSLAGYFLTPAPPMPRYELSEDQRRELAHFLLTEEAE